MFRGNYIHYSQGVLKVAMPRTSYPPFPRIGPTESNADIGLTLASSTQGSTISIRLLRKAPRDQFRSSEMRRSFPSLQGFACNCCHQQFINVLSTTNDDYEHKVTMSRKGNTSPPQFPDLTRHQHKRKHASCHEDLNIDNI